MLAPLGFELVVSEDLPGHVHEKLEHTNIKWLELVSAV
jgi:hypothetical protein